MQQDQPHNWNPYAHAFVPANESASVACASLSEGLQDFGNHLLLPLAAGGGFPPVCMKRWTLDEMVCAKVCPGCGIEVTSTRCYACTYAEKNALCSNARSHTFKYPSTCSPQSQNVHEYTQHVNELELILPVHCQASALKSLRTYDFRG